MRFRSTAVDGALEVILERRQDERGFFSRAWCAEELGQTGIDERFVQMNIAHTARRGTIRGLHYQRPPAEEARLVYCVQGAIFDVIADVRPTSDTFGQWLGTELSADGDKAVFVPKGCAHGYQALCDDARIAYLVSHEYSPDFESGVRWNDPAFDIEWPVPDAITLSRKDREWPDVVRPGS